MSGLRGVWAELLPNVWEPLGTYAEPDGAAPPDLYVDLMATAAEYISPTPTEREFEILRNDPDEARLRFVGLVGEDFPNEGSLVDFLETSHGVLEEYDIPGFSQSYVELLRATLRRFNVRYRVDDPCTLRFLLPGSYFSLYEELHRVSLGNAHLAGLLADFEKSFDRYVRSKDSLDLKAALANASKYLEGLVGDTSGKYGSLGESIKSLPDWPHKGLVGSLSSLYGFCSDYPGIRHAGNPNGQLKELGPRDMSSVAIVLLGCAAYLSPRIDENLLLGW